MTKSDKSFTNTPLPEPVQRPVGKCSLETIKHFPGGYLFLVIFADKVVYFLVEFVVFLRDADLFWNHDLKAAAHPLPTWQAPGPSACLVLPLTSILSASLWGPSTSLAIHMVRG